jgi:hypothetical protein
MSWKETFLCHPPYLFCLSTSHPPQTHSEGHTHHVSKSGSVFGGKPSFLEWHMYESTVTSVQAG